MEKEKKTIKILRIVFGVLLVAAIVATILLYRHFDAKVVDWGWDGDYNASTNTTECDVVLEFNVKVEDVKITVQFFDENDNLIDEMSKTCVWEDNLAAASFTVKGDPASCMLVDGSYAYEQSLGMQITIYVGALAIILLIALFVQSLMCKCKTYYYNDMEIVVYAGLAHRHVKVNGVEVCRRNNAFTYGTVELSTTLGDGSMLCAYISRNNKITVMVNNQYLPEVKNPTAAPAAGYQPDTTVNGGSDDINNPNV